MSNQIFAYDDYEIFKTDDFCFSIDVEGYVKIQDLAQDIVIVLPPSHVITFLMTVPFAMPEEYMQILGKFARTYIDEEE